MSTNISKLADELKPYFVPWVRKIAQGNGGSAGGGGTPDMVAHTLADTSALGTFHTVSGLTAGQVLVATAATAAHFAQLTHSQLGGVSADQHHAQVHALNGTDHTGSLAWTRLDKGGSSLADLATRNYSALQGTGDPLDIVGWNATDTIGRIAPSSNPGGASRILRTDGSGLLALSLFRTPSIDTAAGPLTLAPVGSLFLNPTGDYVLPTNGYDINLGAINYKYLTVHAAELWVETLVAQNTLATIGGRILVGPTTTLIVDLPAANTAIDVKYNNLAAGDRIYLEAGGRVEFMAVTSYVGTVTGGYRYTVTRDLDGSVANDWYAGDAVFNTGQVGSGFIDLYSLRGVKAATEYGPTIVGNVRTGTAFNAWEPRWAIGNLRNLYDYSAETYGLAAGQSSGTWFGVDATNGLRMMRNTTARFQIDTSGNLRVKNNAGTDVIALDNDGTSYFAGPMTIGTSGGIYQGTGTFASPTTGLKIWNASGVGRLAGYLSGVEQAGFDTSGRIVAGAGNVTLDANGITLEHSTTAETTDLYFTMGNNASASIRMSGGNLLAEMIANVYRLGVEYNYFTLSVGNGGTAKIRLSENLGTNPLITMTGAATVSSTLGVTGLATLTGGALLGSYLGTSSGVALELKQDGTSVLYSAKTAADATLQLGNGRTVDGNAFIDLVADTTYTDYGMRVYRYSGANGNAGFAHRGTGYFRFSTAEAAEIQFWTNSTSRMTINSSGLVGIGVTPATQKLKVFGSVAVGADEGGTASYTTLTNATSGKSTGVGTVKLAGTSNRDSTGWVKAYVGTTAVWLPYWDNIGT